VVSDILAHCSIGLAQESSNVRTGTKNVIAERRQNNQSDISDH